MYSREMVIRLIDDIQRTKGDLVDLRRDAERLKSLKIDSRDQAALWDNVNLLALLEAQIQEKETELSVLERFFKRYTTPEGYLE